jgi:translocator protein
MNEQSWYSELIKPQWAPPSWIFGPVWSVLYAIIAITYGTVFYYIAKGVLPVNIAVPFVLNLIFNAAFTPLQFGLRSNVLASIDIVLVLITLIWMFWVLWPHAGFRWIIYANIPYLIWVSFATILQFSITKLNI